MNKDFTSKESFNEMEEKDKQELIKKYIISYDLIKERISTFGKAPTKEDIIKALKVKETNLTQNISSSVENFEKKKILQNNLKKCEKEIKKFKNISDENITYLIEFALERIEKIKKAEEEDLLKIYTDEDLIKYKPKENKWLIENQIPEGEIGVLAGKRGERKTFTALVQALCLASGQDCFGDKVPEKKKVLFISEEDSIDTIATRIKVLKKGMGIEKEKLDINYSCLNSLKLDFSEGSSKINALRFVELRNILEKFKPDLVIIDALQRCVSFEVDKDNRAISELFTETIRPLSMKYDCSWLFITHLRKSPTQGSVVDPLDEIRGGSELVNYCRFVLSCQAPRNQSKTEEGSDLIIFKALKMSNAQIQDPKVISWTTNEDKLIVENMGLPQDVLASEVQVANAIMDWLVQENKITFQTKDINEASEQIGCERTFISYGLKHLIKQGKIKKVKRGHYEVIGKEITQTKITEEKPKKKDKKDTNTKQEKGVPSVPQNKCDSCSKPTKNQVKGIFICEECVKEIPEEFKCLK